MCSVILFFFKQKTAYEMRISDWSSDVCSSDLRFLPALRTGVDFPTILLQGFYGLDRAFLAACRANPDRDYGYPDSRLALRPERTHARGIGWSKNRSEERRVGKDCFRTCRSRWSPYHSKKKHIIALKTIPN